MEDLGTLGVRVVLDGTRVQVRVECMDAAAVAVVEACRRELARSLQQHDLSLAGLEVGVQPQQGRGGAPGHPQRELPDGILAGWATVPPYPPHKPDLGRAVRTGGLDALA